MQGQTFEIYHWIDIDICRNSDTISDNNQNMFRNYLKNTLFKSKKKELQAYEFGLKYLTLIPWDIVVLNRDSHSLQWKIQIACPCKISQARHSSL